MSFWPFRKRVDAKQAAPGSPPAPIDQRVWNEDWQVGDTAECVCDDSAWHPEIAPWHRAKKGQRFVVIGFTDGVANNARRYFLKLEGWPVRVSTNAFRKVRPVATEQSEIVERILSAKPGTDRKRETA